MHTKSTAEEYHELIEAARSDDPSKVNGEMMDVAQVALFAIC